ncbi:MAG: hypothetical protein JWQ36_175, partial [Enterovirga sp.]|nr:hypothetical protein [Enterovirga sp.]
MIAEAENPIAAVVRGGGQAPGDLLGRFGSPLARRPWLPGRA